MLIPLLAGSFSSFGGISEDFFQKVAQGPVFLICQGLGCLVEVLGTPKCNDLTFSSIHTHNISTKCNTDNYKRMKTMNKLQNCVANVIICNTNNDMSIHEDGGEVVITVRLPRLLKEALQSSIGGRYSTVSEWAREKIREEVERNEPAAVVADSEEDAA